jgi:hypothetical protein
MIREPPPTQTAKDVRKSEYTLQKGELAVIADGHWIGYFYTSPPLSNVCRMGCSIDMDVGRKEDPRAKRDLDIKVRVLLSLLPRIGYALVRNQVSCRKSYNRKHLQRQ